MSSSRSPDAAAAGVAPFGVADFLARFPAVWGWSFPSSDVVATPSELVDCSTDTTYLGAVLSRTDFESLSIDQRNVLMRQNFALVVLDAQWQEVALMLEVRRSPPTSAAGFGSQPYAATRGAFSPARGGYFGGEGTIPQAGVYYRLLGYFTQFAAP